MFGLKKRDRKRKGVRSTTYFFPCHVTAFKIRAAIERKTLTDFVTEGLDAYFENVCIEQGSQRSQVLR
ncbi:MAG: hypothetical protein WC242_03515 [Candidatus Paceibacterota bacterium]|jgi:hypothetical protein